MNILVTGANGQLGNEIRILAQESVDNYIFTDVNQVEGLSTLYLDITDIDAIRKIVAENNVNAIVNCAAWTNVDACESDDKFASLAERLNAEAPKFLAHAMREVGGVLFHISTDYVFGQEPYNKPCKPEQNGTPTGVYGATKKRGEQYIISIFEKDPLFSMGDGKGDYIILRTAWLYSEFGKNFCKTMLDLTSTKPELKVVFDQCGTPTYAYDLASAICNIIANRTFKGNSGIYHYSNEGVTSWYDFAQMIARIANHRNCHIQPCYSSEYPSPVKRPSYSVLDKTKFKETFGLRIPYWVDSLEVCIKRMQWK